MRRSLPMTAAIVLGVVVVGLAIASGWLGVSSLRNKDEADQRAKAIQSARQMGVNLMSVDSANAQRDLDRIVAAPPATSRTSSRASRRPSWIR
ncbi:Tar ligand binding domain-containing protein [Actinomadura madurae]|uniref:Tar ligand binding domain-containing protein n=1 Tax=Actinomadura madurae TaxID=1993 RepID=UPI0020D207F9|nr:Tar ligand binding domain-containing protein [Actinomadura madurae]MCP9952983.1 hypothetical protein [Actinomadura madurae]MCP9969749.1 hypothetical protein [Actinomadura madurae]MCP9982201.1 hypothetical protein [Actinomadura madurae]MCQ0018450.1 hypothetical protein [Actinomadura madurae]